MNFDQLVSLCQKTHTALHAKAAHVVHATLAARNWLFGWYIVEFEQNGGDRAAYGAATLKSLAGVLKERLGKGFSVDALEQMRRFYLTYSSFAEPWMKSGTLSRISGPPLISGTVSRKSHPPAGPGQPPAETGVADPLNEVSADWLSRFTLGWSQYVEPDHHRLARRAELLRNRGRRQSVERARTPAADRQLPLRTPRPQPG